MIRYTHEHVWLRLEDGLATAGITPHAQDTLGEIVSVGLPAIGAVFEADAVAGLVESIKTASDIHMPATGEIVAVNDALAEDPSLANTDPLGAGWFFRFRLAGGGEAAALDGLLDEAAYLAFTR